MTHSIYDKIIRVYDNFQIQNIRALIIGHHHLGFMYQTVSKTGSQLGLPPELEYSLEPYTVYLRLKISILVFRLQFYAVK